MKISDVEKRVNASYNTIKRFIEKDDTYNEVINNVLHATGLGIEQLEKEYGIRSELLSDDNVIFYKNQIAFLYQQLEENKKYNDLFVLQIETHNTERDKDKKKIEDLKQSNHDKDLINLELKLKLEQERSRSIFSKIFGKKTND